MPRPAPPTPQDGSSATSSSTTFATERQWESSCPLTAPAAGAEPSASSFLFRVPHVQQAFNWDCGLACVLMVLKALNLRQYDMAALRKLCPTQSIWTIDLAHLLCRCGVLVSFFTVYLGANPSYAGERFYAEHIAEDEARVGKLFQDAPAAGITVLQRSMPLRELQSTLLAAQHLAIALVDKSVLQPAQGPAAGAVPQKAAYTGHYILICGYDAPADAFHVCDPASVQERLQVPATRLDAARRSFGTDEDLLLIHIPRSSSASSV